MGNFVKFRKSVMFAVKVLIVAAVTLGFIEVWNTCYLDTLFSKNGNLVVIFAYIFIFVTFASLYSAFNIGIHRIHETIYSFSLAAVFTDFVMYLILSLIARKMVAIPPMIFCIAYQVGIIFISCLCANVIYFKLHAARKVIAIFGDEQTGFNLINKMRSMPERFNVQCGVNASTTDMENIKKLIDKYEAVIICDIDKNKEKEIFSYCYSQQKRTYLLPAITDIIINNSYEIQISDTPVLMSRNRGLTTEQEIVKRIMDIVISLIAIILSSPFMIICAIAIKFNDGGPVFFRQNRVTKNGKIFNVLKFRSMVVDAEKKGALKATDNDDRITKVGRVIRACRMDELPQFFNILKGDMSVVGPRPERIENVYEYSKAYPEFDLRHRVKGGLTGYAQIYGKYNTSPEDKLNMDLIYIETYSVLQDIKLLILTIKILFMKESTEGFDNSANKNVQTSKSLRENKE